MRSVGHDYAGFDWFHDLISSSCTMLELSLDIGNKQMELP
jgi:hypothetical protein